jgi:hypothetical protein
VSPDAWASIITGFFAIVVVIVSATLPRLLKQGRDIKEVKEQVKNSHGTNLRDDLDALRYEVRGGFSRVFEHMGEVRTDLLAERAERLRLADLLTDKVRDDRESPQR